MLEPLLVHNGLAVYRLGQARANPSCSCPAHIATRFQVMAPPKT